jgi:hypothetical protein
MVRLAGLPLTSYATQHYLSYSNYRYTIPVLPLVIAGGFSLWPLLVYYSITGAVDMTLTLKVSGMGSIPLASKASEH